MLKLSQRREGVLRGTNARVKEITLYKPNKDDIRVVCDLDELSTCGRGKSLRL